ncbi:Uncharacterised protein [Pseudomonas fluorescens]|uniref:Uncharacterized protein n=1 Tax=Pseudomonas fluorescens TaxID=294 RepID=A0A379IGN5_PSEFL|nr:hypothetical protein [Pseudomonas fluorescens]SUD31443.1 Uncharacterised protein [Pseudomonas fluorescens]
MTLPTWLRLSWFFNRRVGATLVWICLVVGAAVAVNIAGIHLVGDIHGWERWLQAHSGYFLLWRLCLYAVTATGWWWMRGRLRQREPAAETHRRLLRTEIATVIAIVLLEGSAWLRHG